ncbi:MAG: hypothetical protein WEB05_03505 [Solirubrobacterales bacterium]
MTFAITASEFGLVILLTALISVPIAVVAFARSGKALEELGKGRFAIDRDDDLGSGMTGSDSSGMAEQERAEEVRQMVEAADFRSQARGGGRVDIEREIERLMAGEKPLEPERPAEPAPEASPKNEASKRMAGFSAKSEESGLRAEVRQLVVANNERRERRGEEPLDVEAEVERRLKEWG